MCQATVVRVSMLFFKACPEGVFAPRKLHLRPWYLFVLSEVVEHPSLFPARHLRPFRTTLHLSHERDRWRVVLTLTLLWPSCLSSYLILLSLAPAPYTPFPGRPGLFRSSFAFGGQVSATLAMFLNAVTTLLHTASLLEPVWCSSTLEDAT